MKKDAKKVGETADGIPIYEFRYKGDKRKGGPKQRGVMAQDVEKVKPEAVVENAEGLKAVDYSKVREHPRKAGRRGQKKRASLASARMGRMASRLADEVEDRTPDFVDRAVWRG